MFYSFVLPHVLLSSLYYSLYTSNNLPYQYYLLSIQKWCQSSYQIHGLWPQTTTTTYPINCYAPAYTPISGELLDEMKQYWANCDDTQDFWNHEYTKHLSCMYQQYGISQEDSFQIAIDLFKDLDSKDFEPCKDQDDCYVACYNLDFQKITCP